MTILYRLRLHLHTLRHRTLSLLSRDYRDYADQETLIRALRADLATSQAKLANSQTALQAARAEIQTLSISTRQATERASRLTGDLDDSRKREIRALRHAMKSSQCVADWLARQTIARAPIYGVGPEPPAPEPAPVDQSASIGRVHARKMAHAQTDALMQQLEKDYAAAMANAHDGTGNENG